FWDYQLVWDIQQWSWGIAVAHLLNYAIPAIALLISLSFYKNLRLMCFALIFIILYFSGNPFFFAVVFAGLLIWALCQWIADFINQFNKHVTRGQTETAPDS
ncbi:MAG: hypothetical protein WC071_06855, partial [Victivallaceae bacterium]